MKMLNLHQTFHLNWQLLSHKIVKIQNQCLRFNVYESSGFLTRNSQFFTDFDFFGNWLHNHSSSIHINCQHQKIGIPDSQISPSCYQESKLSSIKASNESDPGALMNWTSFSFTLADSWPWCSLISCNCLVDVVECMSACAWQIMEIGLLTEK